MAMKNIRNSRQIGASDFVAKIILKDTLIQNKMNQVKFSELKEGDRVKTKQSGMATVVRVGCYNGKMVMLQCDDPRWTCPYFYESELDLESDEK
jgi:hypothetical protein